MEVAGAYDDLGLVLGNSFYLVAPFARGFERCFDSFCAGVHGENHVVTGEFAEFLAEQGILIVAKGARAQGDFGGLFLEGTENLWVAVTLVDGGVGGQAIEIAAAFDVIDPHAFSPLEHDVERIVVVRSEFVFQVDEVLGRLGRLSFEWCHGALSV